ncbi:integrase core domain-containing protein [Candidatus Rariloculus sp.]
MHWFDDSTNAKAKLQAWQRKCNETRPHRALNELSPLEYRVR